jgi:DNA-binding PadR family transcriptional regulator
MSVRQSMLAVLSLGDCHGYQIRSELESRTGSAWQINIGQIYATLDRLERDGLVVAHEANDEGQNRYSITNEGRTEVLAWLMSPVERSAMARDELVSKLALAVTLPNVDVQTLLDTQRFSTMHSLQTLTTAKKSADENDPRELAWIMILDSQIFNAEAELRWLDHVEGLLHRSAARGLSPQSEIQSQTVKRGRPIKRSNDV